MGYGSCVKIKFGGLAGAQSEGADSHLQLSRNLRTSSGQSEQGPRNRPCSAAPGYGAEGGGQGLGSGGWQRASGSPRSRTLGCPGAGLSASWPLGLWARALGKPWRGRRPHRPQGCWAGARRAQGVGPRLQPQRPWGPAGWGPAGWRPVGRAEQRDLAFRLGIFSAGSPGPLLSAAPPLGPRSSPPVQAAGGRREQWAVPGTAARLWESLGTCCQSPGSRDTTGCCLRRLEDSGPWGPPACHG